MRYVVGKSLTGAATAAVLAVTSIVAFAGSAQAAPAAGQATFYSNTDFTGTQRTVPAGTCDSTETLLGGHFSSVINLAPPFCVAQVYTNVTPSWVPLCRGSSVLAGQLRNNLEVRFVPGVATPCP
jgi:hypothetical protein